MTSIKDRIALFNRSSSKLGSSKGEKPSEKPSGNIVWHGWLGKQGSGVLSATYSKRYCVLHVTDQGPMFSPCTPAPPLVSCAGVLFLRAAQALMKTVVVRVASDEGMDMERLKGDRISLGPQSAISQADDKLQIAYFLESKSVTARFKADSKQVAVEWCKRLNSALSGEAGSSEAAVPTAAPTPTPPTPTPINAAKDGSPQPAPSPPPKSTPTKDAPASSRHEQQPPAPPAPVAPSALAAPSAPAPTKAPAAAAAASAAAGVVSPAFLDQLAALANRVGQATGVAPTEAASGKLKGGDSAEELATRLAELVEYLESCADQTALKKLEGFTVRLESRLGLVSPSVAPPPAASATLGMAAMVGQLEVLVARMEVAASA